MADGFIAGFATKFETRFWRPVTAIREAADDGNRRRRLTRTGPLPHDSARSGLSLNPHRPRCSRSPCANPIFRGSIFFFDHQRDRTWRDPQLREFQRGRDREWLVSRVCRHSFHSRRRAWIPTGLEGRSAGTSLVEARAVAVTWLWCRFALARLQSHEARCHSDRSAMSRHKTAMAPGCYATSQTPRPLALSSPPVSHGLEHAGADERSGATHVLECVQGVTIPPKVGWCALHDSNVRPPGS